jgi:predicted lactoylglutathione lyase
MDRTRPTLNQLNIVSSNPDASIAFYRRLGVDIPDERIWRTATGAHHASAVEAGTDLDLDSATFAQIWNKGWTGRKDLAGRVVVGFSVASRQEVDRLYGEMTAGGRRRPTMPSGARAMPSSKIQMASPSAS